MPNYSKARTLFSSVNKKLWEIPWAEAHAIYKEVKDDLFERKQLEIDQEYEEEIARLEQDYTDSHEAPYEGNFSDSTPKRSVIVTQSELEDEVSSRIKKEFIEKYKLVLHVDWVMPQIITFVGNLPKYLDDEGKFCGLQFRNKNFKTDAEKGLYRFLMSNERSSYLKLQYKMPNRVYSSLVPLILYAQRLVDQTPYSAWSRDTLEYVVNSDLCGAMLSEIPEGTTRDELIRIREVGLLDAKGVPKNPVSTHMLYGREQSLSVIGNLPRLAKVMLTQIWVAHPDNRTKYMVLNPRNWDKVPPCLIDVDPIDPKPEYTGKLVVKDSF